MLRWLLPLLGGLPVFGATGKDTEALSISFNDHVRPILADKCYACHGPDPEDRAADLRLDTEEEDEIMPPPDSQMFMGM